MRVDTDRRQALLDAAAAARYAPSVHNTQPWRWVARPDRLELYAVAERRLDVQDPDSHMLLLSCGAALHHAQVALRAAGWRFDVDRPATSPLAVIRPHERAAADAGAAREFELLTARRTDRRSVADTPIDPGVLDRLVTATEGAGARLHPLGPDQVIELAVVAERAQRAQSTDERLHQESARWVGGDRAEGAGIPAANVPRDLPQTTVALRDLGAGGALAAGSGHDNAATYAVLYGGGDEPADWLLAGEALDALWLAAVEHGVTLLPLSGPVEVPLARHELGRLIGDVGLAYLVVRLGLPSPDGAAPEATPRLPVEQIIEIRD